MSKLAEFRKNKCLQLEYSLATGRSIDNLIKRSGDFHGNTQFNSFLDSTRGSSSPIDWLDVDDSLNIPISVLKYAAQVVATLEVYLDLPYTSILDELKFKHGNSTLSYLFSSVADDPNWDFVTKNQIVPLLKEFDWWVGLVDSLDCVGYEIARASDLHQYLDSPLLKNLHSLVDVLILGEKSWDADKHIFNNLLKKLSERNSQFVSEWITDARLDNHFNAKTKREYGSMYSWLFLSLCSQVYKFKSNIWATQSQWEDLGFELIADAKPAVVVHYFNVTAGSKINPSDDSGNGDSPFRRKTSIVFNADEVTSFDGQSFPESKVTPLSTLENRLIDLDVSIDSGFGDAYYNFSEDRIYMPNKEFFKAKNATKDYYSTLLHELVHWTGHSSRCNRKLGRTGTKDYAFEELVAEIGSAFLCSRFGLIKQVRSNSCDYIASWLSQFSLDDSIQLLEKAARLANQASNYIYVPKRDDIF